MNQFQKSTIQHRTLQKQMYYNDETKLNERENNNTSKNTKTNKNNLQTVLEHNKHDYIKIDPKTNNDNQEQSTRKNTSRQKLQANKIMIKSNK